MNRKDEITLQPIGVIHSEYKEQQGTPIQPGLSNNSRGRVVLFPEYADGLDDLDGFERIWLIYRFDRIAETRLRVTPYLDKNERGIFATRSPARPNRIGMSPVKLLRITGLDLEIEGVDILDNTPLLDIKPYIPKFDIFPVTRTGWYPDDTPGQVLADNRFSPKS